MKSHFNIHCPSDLFSGPMSTFFFWGWHDSNPGRVMRVVLLKSLGFILQKSD